MFTQQVQHSSGRNGQLLYTWSVTRLLVLSAASVWISLVLEIYKLPPTTDGILATIPALSTHPGRVGLPNTKAELPNKAVRGNLHPSANYISDFSRVRTPSTSSRQTNPAYKRRLLKKTSQPQQIAELYHLRSTPYTAHATPQHTPTSSAVQPPPTELSILTNSISGENPTITTTTSSSQADAGSSTQDSNRIKLAPVYARGHSVPGPLYVDFAPVDGSVFWLRNLGRAAARNCAADLSVDPEANTPIFLTASTFETHQKWRFTLVPGTPDTFLIQTLAYPTTPQPDDPASQPISPQQLPGSFLSYSTNCDSQTLHVLPYGNSPSHQAFRLTRLSPSSNEFVLSAVGRSACRNSYLSAAPCAAAGGEATSALPHFASISEKGPQVLAVFELMHTTTAAGFPLAGRTFRIRSSSSPRRDLPYSSYLTAPSCNLPDPSVHLSPSSTTNPISPTTTTPLTHTTSATIPTTVDDASPGDDQLLWTFRPLRSATHDLFVIQSLHRQRSCPESPSYLSCGSKDRSGAVGVRLAEALGRQEVFRVFKTPGGNGFVFRAVARAPGVERFLSAAAGAANVMSAEDDGDGSGSRGSGLQESGGAGSAGAAVGLVKEVGMEAVFELLPPA